MATVATNAKQQAHETHRAHIRRVTLITSMLDPVDRAIANAPFEDQEISDEENRAVAASKAWLKDHEPIPNEEVLAEFGLTAEDFERMGRTPLEPEPHHPGQ